MRPSVHLGASAVISLTLFAVTRSPGLAGISFLSGTLLDLDHVLDYIREYGIPVNPKKFFRTFYGNRFRKYIFIFHAWEWLPVLYFGSQVSGWHTVPVGLLIGFLHHMVIDQAGNGVTSGAYFFIWRASRRFTLECIVRREVLRKSHGQK